MMPSKNWHVCLGHIIFQKTQRHKQQSVQKFSQTPIHIWGGERMNAPSHSSGSCLINKSPMIWLTTWNRFDSISHIGNLKHLITVLICRESSRFWFVPADRTHTSFGISPSGASSNPYILQSILEIQRIRLFNSGPSSCRKLVQCSS